MRFSSTTSLQLRCLEGLRSAAGFRERVRLPPAAIVWVRPSRYNDGRLRRLSRDAWCPRCLFVANPLCEATSQTSTIFGSACHGFWQGIGRVACVLDKNGTDDQESMEVFY